MRILESKRLTLKQQKNVIFFVPFVNYLGFEISESGVQPYREKCAAINNFPAPKDVHQIRQFLGLTGYFRRFVEKYAHLNEPLTRLTRKGQSFQWGAEQSRSFEKLKDQLTSRPILKF